MKSIKNILLIIFFSALINNTRAENLKPIILNDKQNSLELIGRSIEILADKEGTLKIEDVIQKKYDRRFIRSNADVPNFGFTKTVYWGRFKVKFNNKKTNHFILQFNFANLNYVDIYQLNRNGELIKAVKTGNMRPIRSRDQFDPKILFFLKTAPGEEHTIYFRIKNEASMTISLSLISVSEYMKNNRNSELLLGLLLGIMFLIIAYNIFLLFSLKDSSYLFFSLSVFFISIYIMTVKGFSYLFLWPDMSKWNQIAIPISIGLTAIFFIIYFVNFIRLKKEAPLLNTIFFIIQILFVIAIFGCIFYSYILFIIIINILTALNLILLITANFIAHRKKLYRSFYFQTGLLILTVGVALIILVRLGLLPSYTITEDGIIYTTLFFVILMSLALADRVNFYKKELETAISSYYEYEERLRALVETSNDIIWETDKNRKVTYINPRVKDILGFDVEEVLGKDAFAVIIPFYPEKIKRIIRESLNTRKPIATLEYEAADKSGRRVILEKNAAPVFTDNGDFLGFKGVDRDITERKKAELELRKSEERFRTVVENSPVGIVIGSADLIFQYVNPKFTEMTGYQKEELLNQDLSILLDEKLVAEITERYKKRTAGEDVPSTYELEYKRKDGEKRIAEVRVALNRKPDNSIIIITQILDITEHKQLQQKLIQSQKMEALGTLAGGIAHDFNNLLTVIKGYTDICLMRTDKDDKLYKYISAILTASEKAESLTKQILTFSKSQKHHPKVMDVNRLLQELEQIIHRLAGKEITVEMNLKKDLPPILADPAQIEQIIINMVVNSRDAINNIKNRNENKIIRIETETVYKNDMETNKEKNTEFLVITITDTGMGMTPEVLAKIFDPFYTTKDTGKGTGLGLATVYGILQQNNAKIESFSKIGEGTTFKIYWPLYNADNI
jgi:PAS domain S-box-containing protein